MRNVFASGVLDGLGIQPRQFQGALGISSGAYVLAYFLAGQHELAKEMWLERLPKSKVIRFWSPFIGKRFIDIPTLVHDACRDLNVLQLIGSGVPLYTALAEVDTGQTVYPPVDQAHVHDYLSATSSIPTLAGSVTIDGKAYVDGGSFDSLPYAVCKTMGFDKVLVISNLDMGGTPLFTGEIMGTLAFGRKQAARASFRSREARLRKAWQDIARDEELGTAYFISPGRVLPSGHFDRNPKRLEKSYAHGLSIGQQHQERVQAFLQ